MITVTTKYSFEILVSRGTHLEPAPNYHPLSRKEIGELLHFVKTHKNNTGRNALQAVSERFKHAIPGMTKPFLLKDDIANKLRAMNWMFAAGLKEHRDESWFADLFEPLFHE